MSIIVPKDGTMDQKFFVACKKEFLDNGYDGKIYCIRGRQGSWVRFGPFQYNALLEFNEYAGFCMQELYQSLVEKSVVLVILLPLLYMSMPLVKRLSRSGIPMPPKPTIMQFVRSPSNKLQSLVILQSKATTIKKLTRKKRQSLSRIIRKYLI